MQVGFCGIAVACRNLEGGIWRPFAPQAANSGNAREERVRMHGLRAGRLKARVVASPSPPLRRPATSGPEFFRRRRGGAERRDEAAVNGLRRRARFRIDV